MQRKSQDTPEPSPADERGVEARHDPRDGGNITPEGEVLWLDESRLSIREKPDRPLRKNHPTGLGIKDRFAKRTSALMTGSDKGGDAFAKIVSFVAEPETSLKHKLTSSFLGFDDKGYTHVQVIPLNVDLSDRHHNVVLPVDLMIQELKEAKEIAILDSCICRKNRKCEHYPHDFGCIFMGPNARHALETGIAHRATVEEGVEHIMKAAELGLMGASDFVEGEQFIWGVKNSEMNEYRMFCFCCDCCCLAMDVLKNSSRDLSDRYAPVGWTATVNHGTCAGCRSCEPRCPQHCISYREDGTCTIDQDRCLGCGFCKLACEHGAIKIRQTMPMRASLNEYFLAEARIDDGREHSAAGGGHGVR